MHIKWINLTVCKSQKCVDLNKAIKNLGGNRFQIKGIYICLPYRRTSSPKQANNNKTEAH